MLEGDDSLTDEELARLREQSIAFASEINIPIAGFTCDNCDAKRTCEWAFDLYNTDGDCLAMK